MKEVGEVLEGIKQPRPVPGRFVFIQGKYPSAPDRGKALQERLTRQPFSGRLEVPFGLHEKDKGLGLRLEQLFRLSSTHRLVIPPAMLVPPAFSTRSVR